MRRVIVPVLAPVFALVVLVLVRPADAGEQFRSTSPPTVGGSAAVGKTLTLDPGRWTGKPDGFVVQWLRDGEDVVLGTTRTYVPTRADAGHFITVLVTAERAGDESTSAAESDRVPVEVFVAASSHSKPTVSGTARVGTRLTANDGTWDGSGYRFTYQWLANGRALAKATASTYVPAKTDQGKKISVQVTASKSRFASTTVASDVTKAVAKK